MGPLDEIYSHLWTAHGDAFAMLDQSLAPRSPDLLFEIAERMSLSPTSLVLDAGCGRGRHAAEICRRFGVSVVGIDLVSTALGDAARQAPDRVFYLGADVQRIPLRDGSVDAVWCRDMLVHVPDLKGSVEEFARVLCPGGYLMVFATAETELMESREAARIYGPLLLVRRNLSRTYLEENFTAAGLRILAQEEIGSELIEYYDEKDGRASRELMRLARMRRRRAELVALWGQARFEIVEALYLWMTYHLVGKLSSLWYLLQKPWESRV